MLHLHAVLAVCSACLYDRVLNAENGGPCVWCAASMCVQVSQWVGGWMSSCAAHCGEHVGIWVNERVNMW